MNHQFLNRSKEFALFERMAQKAEEELYRFTLETPLDVSHKADRTVVTGCDSAIDAYMTQIVEEYGLPVVSEEGMQSAQVLQGGTYCVIDPVDGTREYIESVNDALKDGSIQYFLKSPRSRNHNFCLLVGVVNNGVATHGSCYDYVTGEKFLVDATAPGFIHSTMQIARKSTQRFPVIYVDSRVYSDPEYGQRLKEICKRVPNAEIVTQGSFGLNALHALFNSSPDALVFHPVQQSGLWDVLPAAVAARAFGGQIFDGQGKELVLNSYAMIPGPGLYVLKGNLFRFVIDEL